MWDERHRFLNNQKIFRYLLFMTMVLAVAFCWVGMDVVFLSRDGAQQAVAMRFVDEEWSPGNTFMELATPGDWWAWAEGPLLDALYEDPLPVWDGRGRPRAAAAAPRRFPLLGGLGTAVGAPADVEDYSSKFVAWKGKHSKAYISAAAESKVWRLEAESELRFEVGADTTLTVALRSGSIELLGIELATNREYSFTADKLALFTWHGATLETRGETLSIYESKRDSATRATWHG